MRKPRILDFRAWDFQDVQGGRFIESWLFAFEIDLFFFFFCLGRCRCQSFLQFLGFRNFGHSFEVPNQHPW